jgi:hypothetical protein
MRVIGMAHPRAARADSVCHGGHAHRLAGPAVVQKGAADVITDGATVLRCDEEGSYRRAGGQVGVVRALLTALCLAGFHTSQRHHHVCLSPTIHLRCMP